MKHPMKMALLGLLACAGCDAGGSSLEDAGGGGGAGVAQGGAQDFGQFRQILEDGGLPHPSND